jgi:hypothetical protein
VYNTIPGPQCQYPFCDYLKIRFTCDARDNRKGLLLRLLDFLYAPNLSIDQPYLDSMWVRWRVGQNVLDDSSGQFSCSLILLEND